MISTTCLIAWMPGSIAGPAAGAARTAPPQATARTAVRTPTAPIATGRIARCRAADHRTADECRAGVGSKCPLSTRLYRIATMRRTALVLVVLVAALGLVAAGCGGEESQSPAPETVQGEVLLNDTATTETTGSTSTETTTG